MRPYFIHSLSACLLTSLAGSLWAQEGRIFNVTDETVAIWEMNDLGVDLGLPLPNGTVVADVSGNGHDAVVEANNSGTVAVVEGDVNCGDTSTSVGRVAGGGAERLVVNDDGQAFEFDENTDFSVELYVRRAEETGGENWGILAGTWHSRTLLDDTQDPIVNGAWYGYGFIRHTEGGGWTWNCSPINPDGTFTPSYNELSSARFEIEAGSHYVVASVDRQANLVSVYYDGNPVGTVGLPAGTAFIKPTGYEPARFTFLTGEDDSTRNAYRPAPTGYAIDAARVQRRAMTPEEILDNAFLITDCVPVPDTTGNECRAVVTASSRTPAVGQCVVLSGANSTPSGTAETITKYEWKIGAGNFTEGTSMRELSFDTPTGPAGIEVSLRVTDSASCTSTASLSIVASHLAPVARIEARRGTDGLGASPIIRVGDVLTLDGLGSSTSVPGNAFVCPIANGILIPESAITEFRWDVNSDGTIESTQSVFDMPAAASAGTFSVKLTVVNASGIESSSTLPFEVVTVPDVCPSPPGRIFLPTPETIAIWEMNDLPVDLGEPLPDGTVIPDISGNGLDAVVEANEQNILVAGEGDPLYTADNTSIAKSAPSNVARIVVNDDEDAFEMDETESFSIELYVRRAQEVGGENWGILAGTWHSRTLLDDGGAPDQDGAWYGYGFIRHIEGGGWRFTTSPINPDGSFSPSFNEILTGNFEIPAGSHYVVATVDRTLLVPQARVYLDGVQVGMVVLPVAGALITPTDYEHARFMFLTGEDDSTRGSYRPAPTGYAIDAARVLQKALTPEEVRQNFILIKSGVAVPPTPKPCEVTTLFHRGDADDNSALQITDALRILGFLFLGGPAPTCLDSGDADDNGGLQITDALRILGFLFLGGPPPSPPGPPGNECGRDPTDDDGLGCDLYTSC